MDLYNNEHSFEMLTSREEAREKMNKFVQILAQGDRLGISSFITLRDFCSFELASSYTISDWCRDQTVKSELRVLVLQKAFKEPYLEDVLEDYALSEGEFRGKRALGLHATHLFDGIAASLDTSDSWRSPSVSLVVREIDENEHLVEKTSQVRNAVSVEHIEVHTQAAREYQKVKITTGFELWENRTHLFPRLHFCSEDAKALVASSAPREIQAAKRMLGALDEYAEDDARQITESKNNEADKNSTGAVTNFGGAFNPTKISGKVSPESAQTMANFGRERTVKCIDGVVRVFSWHCKDNFTGWRVFFSWEPAHNPPMVVGYIGPHLPTFSEPT